MVGKEGIEPSLSYENQILSLARLPVSPFALIPPTHRGKSSPKHVQLL